jgi:hypothetical protein
LANRIGSLRTNAHVQPGWSAPSTRVERAVDEGARADLRRQGEAASDVTLTPAEHRVVDGEHQCLVTGRVGAVDHLLHEAAIAPDVHLEPLRAIAHGCDLFDRAGAERRERVREPEARGGTGDGELALWIADPREARRREDQRERELLAQHRGGRVDGGHVTQDTGMERDRAEVAGVAGQAALVLGRAVDVVEHAAGQAPLRDAAEVRHAGDPA